LAFFFFFFFFKECAEGHKAQFSFPLSPKGRLLECSTAFAFASVVGVVAQALLVSSSSTWK